MCLKWAWGIRLLLRIQNLVGQKIQSIRNIRGFFFILNQGRIHGRGSGEKNQQETASLGKEERQAGFRTNGYPFAFLGFDAKVFAERVQMAIQSFLVCHGGQDSKNQALSSFDVHLGEHVCWRFQVDSQFPGIANNCLQAFVETAILLDGGKPVLELCIFGFFKEFAQAQGQCEEAVFRHCRIQGRNLNGFFRPPSRVCAKQEADGQP